MAVPEYELIGQLVIYSLLVIVIFYYILKRPVYRSPITYTALLSALSALTYSILNGVENWSSKGLYNFKAVMSILSTLFLSLAYAPELIGFYRISKQKDSQAGVCISIVGGLWASVLCAIAIILNILTDNPPYIYYGDVETVVLFGHCGLTVLVTLLYLMTRNHLHGKAKGSLGACILLFLLTEIIFVLITFIYGPGFLKLVFYDLVLASILIISVIYGHLWTTIEDLGRSSNMYDKVEIGTHDDFPLAY